MAAHRDFFISYNRADEQWAEWIAYTLRSAGYTHYFQKWDFRPGGNFVLEMDKATTKSKRTLLVLSPTYLSSLYTQPEWAAAFAKDPTGEKRLLLPIRVKQCEPGGMLRAIVYCDLVGFKPDAARRRLLAAVKRRALPTSVPFPGSKPDSASFPGLPTPPEQATDSLGRAAQKLQSIFATTGATFMAQARLRDELAARIRKRLKIRKHHEYEELFDLYFKKLRPDELRLHRTIRAYTESILHDHNRRALRILKRNPYLANVISSFHELQQHLVIWLEKFDRVFRTTPSMCLLYVGVEEAVGFPQDVEDDLAAYLDPPGRHRRARGRES